MPTQEDRLDRLEQKVASMELERLYEQRKASESTPSEQAYNLKEVNHHLTILLGIASGQERDIKIVKEDVQSIKDRVERMDQHISSFEEKVDQHFAAIDQRFAAIDQRFVAIDQRFAAIDQRFIAIDQRFAAIEGKLEQVLQMLTTLTKY